MYVCIYIYIYGSTHSYFPGLRRQRQEKLNRENITNIKEMIKVYIDGLSEPLTMKFLVSLQCTRSECSSPIFYIIVFITYGDLSRIEGRVIVMFYKIHYLLS